MNTVDENVAAGDDVVLLDDHHSDNDHSKNADIGDDDDVCSDFVGGVHENNVVYSHSVVDDDLGDGLDVDAVVVGGLNADCYC